MASLPVGTPGGSIVTHPGSAAIDKVVEFLQRCASHGFEGRRLYVVVNRIQRSGEERVCAAPIEKAGGSLGLDIAILGTIPESATTVAFENIAFQIERLRPRGPIAAVEDAVTTPQKAKTRKPQTARLLKIGERIDDLEGVILVQRDAIKRLQDQIGQLEGSSRAPGRAFAKSRYFVPLAGTGLALLALVAIPPLLRTRPDVQQVASAQIAGVQEQSSIKSPEPDKPTESIKSAPPIKPAAAVEDAAVRQVLPDVPQSARDTIRGKVTVSVRVRVNPSGNVTEAVLDSSGPSRYFANLALQAAKAWEFTTNHEGGNVPREWLLRFEFGNETTNVFTGQAAP